MKFKQGLFNDFDSMLPSSHMPDGIINKKMVQIIQNCAPNCKKIQCKFCKGLWHQIACIYYYNSIQLTPT